MNMLSRRPIKQAIYSAHRLWAKRYPEWEAAFFDEHFLRTHVLPLFGEEVEISAERLAQAWVAQFHNGVHGEQKLIRELTPIAADFLYFVTGELRYFQQKAQQPSILQRIVWGVRGNAKRTAAAASLPH